MRQVPMETSQMRRAKMSSAGPRCSSMWGNDRPERVQNSGATDAGSASLLRQRLVEIEDRATHPGPRRVFDGIDLVIPLRLPRRQQLLRRTRVVRELLPQSLDAG